MIVFLILVVAVAADPVPPGDLAEMLTDLTSAYLRHHSAAAACVCHPGHLYRNYYPAEQVLMCPAVRAVLLRVVAAFDPELPDVIVAGMLVSTVERLRHVSAALRNGELLHYHDQGFQDAEYLVPYYLALHACVAAPAEKIFSARPALYSVAVPHSVALL